MIIKADLPPYIQPVPSLSMSNPLLHPLQVVSHLEWCIRLCLDLLDLDTRRKLSQRESANLSVYLEDTLFAIC